MQDCGLFVVCRINAWCAEVFRGHTTQQKTYWQTTGQASCATAVCPREVGQFPKFCILYIPCLFFCAELLGMPIIRFSHFSSLFPSCYLLSNFGQRHLDRTASSHESHIGLSWTANLTLRIYRVMFTRSMDLQVIEITMEHGQARSLLSWTWPRLPWERSQSLRCTCQRAPEPVIALQILLQAGDLSGLVGKVRA